MHVMETELLQHTVKASEAGTTLQDFLARRMGLSRNRAKQCIDSRQVLVNRRRIWMARHALGVGDTVELHAPAAPATTRSGLIPVLVDDGACLVVNKPAGLLANGPNSVESLLRKQQGIPTLLAVHRLDRDTSGCLLFARDTAAFDSLVAAFRKHSVRKTYHALVSGTLRPPEQIINTPIEGKKAVTRLRTLASRPEASHLLVMIDTGRTHQIRKHLASVGHPILGDTQYAASMPVTDKLTRIRRQMLHAASIEFDEPTTNRRIRASAALPADFGRALGLFGLR